VTYQLLSGRLPYEAASLTELALKQQRESPPYLHEIDPQIPEALSHAVDRALALDVADRWPSATAMRSALLGGAKGGPVTAATHVVAADSEATQVVGPPTGATRVATGAHPTSEAPAARVPRPPRPGAVAPAPVAQHAVTAPRRRSGPRNFLMTFLLLVVLAGGGAAAVIATSGSDRAVHLRKVTGDRVNDIVDSLKSLVDDNTR